MERALPVDGVVAQEAAFYTDAQLREVYLGIEAGMSLKDVEAFGSHLLDESQMHEIRKGLAEGLTREQVARYASPAVPWRSMRAQRLSLEGRAAEAAKAAREARAAGQMPLISGSAPAFEDYRTGRRLGADESRACAGLLQAASDAGRLADFDEWAMLFDDGWQIEWASVSALAVPDAPEAFSLRGERFLVLEDVAYAVARRGLALIPAFPMASFSLSQGGTDWAYDEWGYLSPVGAGLAEPPASAPAHLFALYRIHIAQHGGDASATPFLAVDEGAALAGVPEPQRGAFR